MIQGGRPRVHLLDAVDIAIDPPRARVVASEPPGVRHYVCGTSPSGPVRQSFAEHEKCILHGIVSGQGVYQFVSEDMHLRPGASGDVSTIDALQEAWRDSRERRLPLVLGGRFEVLGVQLETPRPGVPAGFTPKADQMHLHCKLKVRDVTRPDQPERTIRLTQAGLRTTDGCLGWQQLTQAHHILQRHRGAVPRQIPLPLILSPSGQGRAPALAAFHEICARIDAGQVRDQQSLRQAMDEFSGQRRLARQTADRRHGRATASNRSNRPSAQEAELHQALRKYLENVTAGETACTGRTADYRPVSSPASAAFAEARFSRWANTGGGNCLFHALEGTEARHSLDAREVARVREEVARVIAGKPDTDEDMRRNAQAYKVAMLRTGEDVSAIPDCMSNEEMAAFQARPGHYAGTTEIRQWLSLERNAGREVVILDAVRGSETINVLTRHVDPTSGKVSIHTRSMPMWHTESSGSLDESQILAAVDAALYDPSSAGHRRVRTIPPGRIVLHATASHFERVTGLVRSR